MAAFEYIHLGQKIEEVLNSKLMTKTELGEMICMSQSNASYLTKRDSIDVKVLHKIGVAVQHNFFKYYPVEEPEGEKNKAVADLMTRIAELEKTVAQQKIENDNLQKENGY